MFVRKSTCDAVIRDRDYYRGLATKRQDRILELAREGDRLQADLESATSGKDWWRDEADRLNERLSQVTAERNRLQAELDKMTGDRNFYRNWKEAIERDFREQKARIADLEAERDQLQAELRQQIAEVARLSAALVDEERASNLILIAERGQIAELNEEVAALQEANAAEHEMGKRVFRENNRLYNEVADMKAELARLRKINPATATVVHFPCRSSFPR